MMSIAMTEDTNSSSRVVVIETNVAEAVMNGVQMYYTPILVYLGALGNCLSVCAFFSTKLRKLSSSFYLAALAISDTGFLVSLFIVWLNMVDVGLFNRQGFCQFFVYLTTLCSFLSVWFVVAFTVERFVAVRYPLRRQSMCTVARAKMVLVGLTILGLLLCSPVLWFSGPQPALNQRHNVTLCNLAEEWQTWAYAFNVADTVMTFIVPFSAIAILNTLIARTIWRLASVRRTMTVVGLPKHRAVSVPRSPRPMASQTKITKMLLVVSTVFLCFNLPAYVMRVRAFLEEEEDPPRTTIVIQHVCNLLFDTNFGINFALYCVSGQNFRRAVVHVLCPRSRRRNDTSRLTVSECVRSNGSSSRRRTVMLDDTWKETHELQSLPKN